MGSLGPEMVFNEQKNSSFPTGEYWFQIFRLFTLVEGFSVAHGRRISDMFNLRHCKFARSQSALVAFEYF